MTSLIADGALSQTDGEKSVRNPSTAYADSTDLEETGKKRYLEAPGCSPLMGKAGELNLIEFYVIWLVCGICKYCCLSNVELPEPDQATHGGEQLADVERFVEELVGATGPTGQLRLSSAGSSHHYHFRLRHVRLDVFKNT
jgi:hypothetical protein